MANIFPKRGGPHSPNISKKSSTRHFTNKNHYISGKITAISRYHSWLNHVKPPFLMAKSPYHLRFPFLDGSSTIWCSFWWLSQAMLTPYFAALNHFSWWTPYFVYFAALKPPLFHGYWPCLWPFHQPGFSASAASLAAFGRAALGAEPDLCGASAVEAWRIIMAGSFGGHHNYGWYHH